MNTTFKTIAGYAGMAFIVAGIAVARTGAQNGNPFQDKNESGEIVHVLPAPALVQRREKKRPKTRFDC